MIMLCRYKPCTLWILYYAIQSLGMVIFTVSMYLYVGGFLPSYRLEYCWHWSLLHHTLSLALSLCTAVIIYRNVLSIAWNRSFLMLQLILCVSAGCLSGVIWFRVTRKEYHYYLETEFKETYRVPPFINWFQFSQACCGVTNYKDYIHFAGTERIYEKYYEAPNVSPDGPNFAVPVPGAALPASNAKKVSRVVFTVPRSCCGLVSRNHSGCGTQIPYTDQAEIERRLSTVTRGCYDLFYTLIYEYRPTQITAMCVVFRTYPLVDIFFHLLSFYVHAYYYDQNLRAIHAPELDEAEAMKEVPTI